MKPTLAKGVQDKQVREQILRDTIVNVLESNFKKYGFNPIQTPIIERFDVLTSKYAGGEEILKEIYTLSDQGQRELALRYDLTVPLARFVSMNPNLKLPFKRYQMGQVFRDGPLKPGRFREFTQCDADVVGSSSLFTDAELLALASDVFSELNFEVTIKVNSRKVLDALIPVEDKNGFILSLDKLEKIGSKGVKLELLGKGFDEKVIDSVLDKLSLDYNSLKAELKDGMEEIDSVLNYCKLLGVKNVVFTPSLARGLSYYTGTIFEVFLNNSKITSSIGAGGRYDKMIGDFSGKDFPAVGISFGLDALMSALDNYDKESYVDVILLSINQDDESIKLMQLLRKEGVNCEFSLKNVKKGLDFASSYKIPFALFIGEDEVKNNKYTLRDMTSGEEFKFGLNDIVKKIKRL
jgi:histidyl-tRNA synthetase